MRSAHWYGGKDRDGFIHRAWMRRGLPNSELRVPTTFYARKSNRYLLIGIHFAFLD